MLPQLLGLAFIQTRLLLVFIEVTFAALTGILLSRILHRELRRRRQNRETALRHYARSMEDFPELATR